MKKFLALVLALLMALSCVSFAGAEGTTIPGTSDTQCNDGKDHTWETDGEVKRSTCTVAGSQKEKCEKCGATRTVTLPLADHISDAEDETITKSFATCTKPMVVHHTKCSACGQEYDVEVGEANGHKWDAGVVTPETCTTDGYTLYTCTVCGETKKTDPVPAHAFTKSTEKKPVSRHETCEQVGIEGDVYYCTKCGYVPTSVVENDVTVNNTAKYLPVKVHVDIDLFAFDAEEGVCTGFTSQFVAALKVDDVYGKTAFKKTVDLSDADFYYGKTVTAEYQPETCEEDGFVSVTCSCGYTKKYTLPAKKHAYKMVSIEYYNAAKEKVLFKECGFGFPETFEEFIRVMEQIQTGTETGLPNWIDKNSLVGYYDCTKPALVTYKCEKCGNLLNAEEMPATEGHVWYPYSATQMKYGTQKAGTFCYRYDDEEYVADINTCTDYTITYHCHLCSQTKTEEKKGTGHVMAKKGEVGYVVKNEPNCTEEGLAVSQCTAGECQYKELIVLDKQPHTKAVEKVVKAASCTEEGEVEYTCTCGYKWTEVTPSMGGHTYKEVKTVDSSCTKKGHVKVVCAVCGDLKEEYDTPEGHEIPDELITAKNAQLDKNEDGSYSIQWKDCTKDGEATYKCANEECCQIVIVKHTACDHTWNECNVVSCTTKKVDDEGHLITQELEYTCAKCATGKKTETTTETAKHNPVEDNAEVIKIATCTEPGVELVKCYDCGSFYKRSYTQNHVYASQYDPATDKWTYKCVWCDAVKDVELNAPVFSIDSTGITKATQTKGTGKISLSEDMIPMVSDIHVYLRWTYTLANGDDFVFDTVVDVNWTNNAHTAGTFKAKGPSAPTGSTLTKMTIIVTTDANADDLQLNEIQKFGYVVL